MDRERRNAAIALAAVIGFLVLFVGGIELVRHKTNWCTKVPKFAMNACMGK